MVNNMEIVQSLKENPEKKIEIIKLVKNKINKKMNSLISQKNELEKTTEGIKQISEHGLENMNIEVLADLLKSLGLGSSDATSFIQTLNVLGYSKIPSIRAEAIKEMIKPELDSKKEKIKDELQYLINELSEFEMYQAIADDPNYYTELIPILDKIELSEEEQMEVMLYISMLHIPDFKFAKSKNEKEEDLRKVFSNFDKIKAQIDDANSIYEELDFTKDIEELSKKIANYSQEEKSKILENFGISMQTLSNNMRSINDYYSYLQNQSNKKMALQMLQYDGIMSSYESLMEKLSVINKQIADYVEDFISLEPVNNNEKEHEIEETEPVKEIKQEEEIIQEETTKNIKEELASYKKVIDLAEAIPNLPKELEDILNHSIKMLYQYCLDNEYTQDDIDSLNDCVELFIEKSRNYPELENPFITEEKQEQNESISTFGKNIIIFLKNNETNEFYIDEVIEKTAQNKDELSIARKEIKALMEKVSEINSIADLANKQNGVRSLIGYDNWKRVRKDTTRTSMIKIHICEENVQKLRELYGLGLDYEPKGIYLIGSAFVKHAKEKDNRLKPLTDTIDDEQKQIEYITNLFSNPEASIDELNRIISENYEECCLLMQKENQRQRGE